MDCASVDLGTPGAILSSASAGDAITAGSLALAVIALIFALVQARDSRQHAKSLALANAKVDESIKRIETVVSGVNEVAHALPTRVLGDWPDYLGNLAEFIERTQKQLLILCDHPAYGSFSNFAGSMQYQRAIENKLVAGISVSTLFLNPARRLAIDDEFFPEEDRWTPDYRVAIQAWASDWSAVGGAGNPKNRGELIKLLEATNIAALDRLQSAAQLGNMNAGKQCLSWRETTSLMPLYLWVRDGVEAVFAVAVRADVANEIAFITIDPALIDALEATFDRFAQEDACSSEQAKPWP